MSLLRNALAANAAGRTWQTAISGGDADISWQSLTEQVERMARQFTGSHCVALLLDNSAAWVVADLAALQAGVTCVPIPPFFSAEQIRHSLRDAGVDTVVTDRAEQLGELAHIERVEAPLLGGEQLSLLRITPERTFRLPGIAKITYTSGTTGQPKGVP